MQSILPSVLSALFVLVLWQILSVKLLPGFGRFPYIQQRARFFRNLFILFHLFFPHYSLGVAAFTDGITTIVILLFLRWQDNKLAAETDKTADDK